MKVENFLKTVNIDLRVNVPEAMSADAIADAVGAVFNDYFVENLNVRTDDEDLSITRTRVENR